MSKTQQIPELENENLLAKVFTSKKWSKKLSNQNMNYQWIPIDQSQQQSNLGQVQMNIPNASVVSCESCYFTFTMEMNIKYNDIQSIWSSLRGTTPSTGDKLQGIIVQYKNALYLLMVLVPASASGYLPQIKILQKFVDAINSIDVHTNIADLNGNNREYGQIRLFDSSSTNQDIACYQKIMNLPYNSACFIDQTVLSHQNVDKNKQLQQINRLIYRQQYSSTGPTQQFIDAHPYLYYGNIKPYVVYATNSTASNGIWNDTNGVTFSYQVMIPMNKLYWIFEQTFLPLFKLKNPLYCQVMLNVAFLARAFNVLMKDNTGTVSTTLNALNAKQITFIDRASIKYYNMGAYLLCCNDTVMQKSLIEELNDSQGIVLPQEQIWIESYSTSTTDDKEYLTNIGFDSLSSIELGLFLDKNLAYYSGYSSLKDIFGEYRSTSSNITTYTNPQQDQLGWYQTNLSFYLPQITLNAKQTMIGQKYLNSLPFYMTINNRGQDTDNQCPYTENFDYFNKLFIRYEQFTDKYIQDIEPTSINYSGVAIQKQNNNFITTKLANYNTSNYQGGMQEHSGITYHDSNNTEKNTYNCEILYRYKQILSIDQSGNLTQLIQEYML